ncbi:major facilitator superfamily domain-containing protein [Mycena galopus ATCC 62051]|nr:major facilitator superfamily domain-containing protein [Mycena galopus ATCC 62051]
MPTPPSTPRAQTSDTVAEDASTIQPAPSKTQPAPTTVTSPFPEGGLRAWSTVAGAFLVQFCGFGLERRSEAPALDFYTRDYLSQSSSSAISQPLDPTQVNIIHRWIGSINVFIVISGGLVSGRLFDRGYFYVLVLAGSFLQCFSLFMLSLCRRDQFYQIFLAQGVGLGIGAGTVYISSIAVVSHHFQKRRALAMTIVASGSSVGAVVHPIMLNNTFNSLGFPNAVRASAGLIRALLIIACLLMHPRLPPASNHPPFLKSLLRFARDTPYVLGVLGMAAYAIGFYFPLFYLQLDAVTHGMSQNFSFYSLVIMNASSFVGRLSPGFFVHQLGVINMIVAAAGVGAVLILCMIAIKTIASVVVIGVIYGYSIGICTSLFSLPSSANELLTWFFSSRSLRMGVGFAVVGLGGLIGMLIQPNLLKWWRPALFSGVSTPSTRILLVLSAFPAHGFRRIRFTCCNDVGCAKEEPQAGHRERKSLNGQISQPPTL